MESSPLDLQAPPTLPSWEGSALQGTDSGAPQPLLLRKWPSLGFWEKAAVISQTLFPEV